MQVNKSDTPVSGTVSNDTSNVIVTEKTNSQVTHKVINAANDSHDADQAVGIGRMSSSNAEQKPVVIDPVKMPDIVGVIEPSVLSAADIKVTLTILTATDPYNPGKPKNVNKILSLCDGKLNKKADANISSATGKVIQVTSEGMVSLLGGGKGGIQRNQALILGCPVKKGNKEHPFDIGETFQLTTKAREPAIENRTHCLGRTNENFIFIKGRTAFFFDFDGISIPMDELDKILDSIDENVSTCIKVVNVSSSSNIFDSEGNQINGLKGVHIYVFVECGEDIPRYLKAFFDRLWLAGYGHIMIDKAGKMHVRTIIDISVGSPERIVFEAFPTLLDGLEQRRPAPVLSGKVPLDTKKLRSLNDDERKVCNAKINEEKNKLKSEANKQRKKFIKKAKKKIFALTKHKVSAYVIEAAIDKGHLYDDWLLKFDHQDECVSVREVLDNPSSYDKLTLADPIEHGYNGGRGIAILYVNKNNVVIYSQAHGGRLFRLNPQLHPCTKAINKQIGAGVSEDVTKKYYIDDALVADIISRTFFIPSKKLFVYVQDQNGYVVFAKPEMKDQLYRIYDKHIYSASYKPSIEKLLRVLLSDLSDVEIKKEVKALVDTPVNELLGYIQLHNQRQVVKMAMNVFANKSSVKIHDTHVEIDYKFILPKYPVENVDAVAKKEIIADYKIHFPTLDEVLFLIVAGRIVPDRKLVYLWMHCASNWGKGFFIGLLRKLNLTVDVSQDELKKILAGGPSGKSSYDFINAIVLIIDEFSDLKKEVKQLESQIQISPKNELSFTAMLYTKMFFSADGNSKLETSSGVDAQFANRFSKMKYTGDISQRQVYLKYGSDTYHNVCTEYLATFFHTAFSQLIEDGEDLAIKKSEKVVNAFHKKYGLANHALKLEDGLREIHTELKQIILRHGGIQKSNSSAMEKCFNNNVMRCDKGRIIVKRPITIITAYINEFVDEDAKNTIMDNKDFIRDCLGECLTQKVTIKGVSSCIRCIILPNEVIEAK